MEEKKMNRTHDFTHTRKVCLEWGKRSGNKITTAAAAAILMKNPFVFA